MKASQEDNHEKIFDGVGLAREDPSSPLIEDGRRVLSEMEQNGLKRGLNEPEVYVMCEITAGGIQRVRRL